MSEADIERVVRASRLCYFAPGETILSPAAERPAHCYIIKQGTVRGERPRAAATSGDAVALWELAAGDMFPLGALLASRGVTSVYRATRDTFCLAFPAETFDALITSSPVFGDFCTRRLAHLLDLSSEPSGRIRGECHGAAGNGHAIGRSAAAGTGHRLP